MFSSTPSTLEKLATLSEKEQTVLNKMLNILTDSQSDPADREFILKTLGTYHIKLLYAFSENSDVMHKILDKDPSLNQIWSTHLKTLNYPSHEITSFNKSEKISLFSQLKGAFLLSELAKHDNPLASTAFPILKKACDIGMFQALIKRLNLFCNALSKLKSIPENYLTVILNDVARLSSLYWTMGCIDSSLIIFSVLNPMFQNPAHKLTIERFFIPASVNRFSWLQKYDDGAKPYPISLLEIAVENLYIARLLRDTPESKRIIEQLSQSNSEFAGFDEEIETYSDIQNLAMKKMHSLHIPLVATFCQSAFDHAVATIRKEHPQFMVPDNLNPSSIAKESKTA